MNSAEVLIGTESSPIWGKVVELAQCGCFVEAAITLRKGENLKLGLWIQEKKMWIQARVVNSRPGLGVGVEFTEIADADAESLKTYLASIPRIRMPMKL